MHAKPRSDDKRRAIMAVAIREIAAHGLGAPTAAIAKDAGVSNGSSVIHHVDVNFTVSA